MGVPEHEIQKAREALEARYALEGFLVWPQNWHALRVFVSMATQWRWAVGSRKALRTGMVYEALAEVRKGVKPGIPKHLRQKPGQLLAQLQVMEDTVLREQQKG